MIQISYKLTEKEVHQSLLDISNSRFITKLLRIVGSILLAVMVYITTARLINGTLNFSLYYAFPFFLAIYLTFVSEITAKIQASNLVKKKNPFIELTMVKIYETGFKVKGETYNKQLVWNKLNSIVETKEFFILKETEIMASVLPKRVFTPEETTEFKNLIRTITGPKIININSR
ncbi:YcxB family protein [Dyadobacter sp. NIV53]|uniref:YcxB family protein n=1 Tax=Dyadobacter sp. NIV53 TaxID=2861765 RepID=UPI001C88CFEF|nr:YcxB family protein [Dyadobacter sp. NIV53]